MSWVSTIYLLVISGCILIFGKVSDIIGFRKLFLWGFLLFSAGSLCCGLLPDLSGSFLVLVGSRAFQAVGASMIAAIGPAMVTAYLPMEQKGKAMGIVLTFTSVGTMLGPALGGLLCQYLSWNWIFYVNVPVGIIATLLGAKVIPKEAPVQRRGGFGSGHEPDPRRAEGARDKRRNLLRRARPAGDPEPARLQCGRRRRARGLGRQPGARSEVAVAQWIGLPIMSLRQATYELRVAA